MLVHEPQGCPDLKYTMLHLILKGQGESETKRNRKKDEGKNEDSRRDEATGNEMRKGVERGGGRMRKWKKGRKIDGISNSCKSAPSAVITLVCAITHTLTHTRTHSLPLPIKPLKNCRSHVQIHLQIIPHIVNVMLVKSSPDRLIEGKVFHTRTHCEEIEYIAGPLNTKEASSAHNQHQVTLGYTVRTGSKSILPLY